MNPDLFPILNASAEVKALLGSAPLRVYPWYRAPQNVAKPYAVYGVTVGNPENYLDRAPDMDRKLTQIDIYATTGASAEAVFNAIRDAIEQPLHAHMTNFATPSLDSDTDLYTGRLEFDFLDAR